MNNREKLVDYSGIGPVKVVRNRRARNLSIRINQQGEVRLTVPGYLSLRRAEAFLLSKRSWINKRQESLRKNDGGVPGPVPGDLLVVRGRLIPIEIGRGEKGVEEAIWRILRIEAQTYLPGRVEKLARIYGFNYSGVKIRKMKTRWGSCSAKDGINLNSWLMMLPESLSDYVILHELMHTRYKHHGVEFWDALDSLTGGASGKLRDELRGRRIFSIDPEDQLRRNREVAV